MRKGFTVLEMILVLTVITIVTLITIPNIVQKKEIINNVGCKALVETVNSQILAYQLSDEDINDISILVKEGYLTEKQTTCPNGQKIVIENGQAVVK